MPHTFVDLLRQQARLDQHKTPPFSRYTHVTTCHDVVTHCRQPGEFGRPRPRIRPIPRCERCSHSRSVIGEDGSRSDAPGRGRAAHGLEDHRLANHRWGRVGARGARGEDAESALSTAPPCPCCTPVPPPLWPRRLCHAHSSLYLDPHSQERCAAGLLSDCFLFVGGLPADSAGGRGYRRERDAIGRLVATLSPERLRCGARARCAGASARGCERQRHKPRRPGPQGRKRGATGGVRPPTLGVLRCQLPAPHVRPHPAEHQEP